MNETCFKVNLVVGPFSELRSGHYDSFCDDSFCDDSLGDDSFCDDSLCDDLFCDDSLIMDHQHQFVPPTNKQQSVILSHYKQG